MTGRVSSTDEQADDGRQTGRLLLGGLLALALVATVILVFSESAEWLRVGVLAALWAAFLGALFAAKYRGQVHERQNEIADLQEVYELELEREVAARREYELELEAQAKDQVADEHAKQLEALRAELRVLRENLEALVGGEVLVERVALRAESTRMRSLQKASGRQVDQQQRALSQQRVLDSGIVGGERAWPPNGMVNRGEATVRAEPVAAPNPGGPPANRQDPARRRPAAAPAERPRRVPREAAEQPSAQRQTATEFWQATETARPARDVRRKPERPEPARQAPAAESTPVREPALPPRQPGTTRRESPNWAVGLQQGKNTPAKPPPPPPPAATIDPDWTPPRGARPPRPRGARHSEPQDPAAYPRAAASTGAAAGHPLPARCAGRRAAGAARTARMGTRRRTDPRAAHTGLLGWAPAQAAGAGRAAGVR